MSQVYVDNLDPRVTASDIECEFQSYGDVRSVKVSSRSPGGYAFVDFKDRRDALDAIRSWNGKYGWRVDLSHYSRRASITTAGGSGRAGGRRVGGRFNCYSCGEPGHFARDCPSAFDKKKKGVKAYQKGRKKKDPAASTSAWKPVPPPPPPWLELPEDVMGKILQKLGPIDILENAQKVCTTWRRICKDPAMWRVINMWKLDEGDGMDYDLEIMCRRAVDLSQGQLIEINIEYFGTNKLLEYIAQRSGQLRCLRLARCYRVSAEGLSKAVEKLPFLEELHLQFILCHKECIEAVGQSCPMLKSFTLTDRGCRHPLTECDNEALAVAKTMPELRHLGLFGNKMSNEGLQAILDGCPKLESLDLRRCFNIKLLGELERQCAQQIKDLRRPNDSTQDFGWDGEIFDWGYFVDDDYLPGFSDFDSYYDYGYEDFDFDDFCNPYPFSGGSEDSDYEALFGLY